MNLNSYDDALTKIDKSKTWLNVKYKTLFSREIKYMKYYNISKRYNKTLDITNYYIILCDKLVGDRKWLNTVVDDYGRIKIKIPKEIYNTTILATIESDENINIEKVDTDDSCAIYYLDI